MSSTGFDASVPILMKKDSALSEERFSNMVYPQYANKLAHCWSLSLQKKKKKSFFVSINRAFRRGRRCGNVYMDVCVCVCGCVCVCVFCKQFVTNVL